MFLIKTVEENVKNEYKEQLVYPKIDTYNYIDCFVDEEIHGTHDETIINNDSFYPIYFKKKNDDKIYKKVCLIPLCKKHVIEMKNKRVFFNCRDGVATNDFLNIEKSNELPLFEYKKIYHNFENVDISQIFAKCIRFVAVLLIFFLLKTSRIVSYFSGLFFIFFYFAIIMKKEWFNNKNVYISHSFLLLYSNLTYAFFPILNLIPNYLFCYFGFNWG